MLVFGYLAVAIALSACATAESRPHLSRSEVATLADAQARHDLHHTNIAEYDRSIVQYHNDKHSWYIGYRHKKVPSTWFDVVVDDETGRAVVIME